MAMSARRGRRRAPPHASGRRWNVGVDLGGTRVRVIAVDGDGRRRSAVSPAPGLAGLRRLLRDLWRRWDLSRADVGALVVATRGVWTTAERRAEARRLDRLAGRILVISDAEAAYLGAVGERPGVLLLAGTGSMALGRDGRGRWARAGGLGPLLGDDGSAFWIGREWLRAAGRDGDCPRARRIGRAPDAVRRVAALAPGVLARARRGSRPARQIVRGAQAALAALLRATARELDLRSPIVVSWAGGLLEDRAFRAGVWRAAGRGGPRLRPEPPRSRPVEAALRLASRLA